MDLGPDHALRSPEDCSGVRAAEFCFRGSQGCRRALLQSAVLWPGSRKQEVYPNTLQQSSRQAWAPSLPKCGCILADRVDGAEGSVGKIERAMSERPGRKSPKDSQETDS